MIENNGLLKGFNVQNISGSFLFSKETERPVSDFYWEKNIGSNFIFCLADIAKNDFKDKNLSDIGFEILNNISLEYFENTGKRIVAAEILENFVQKINKELGVEAFKDANYGFSIFSININVTGDLTYKTFDVQWAGIKNPLYIVSKDRNSYNDDSISIFEGSKPNANLYEIKADNLQSDKLSIKNHELQLHNDDLVYVFTDGLIDQIGGPLGKKFMDTQFKNIIIDMTDNEIEDQKFVLDYAFELWKGDFSQNDDVCVIGLKL